MIVAEMIARLQEYDDLTPVAILMCRSAEEDEGENCDHALIHEFAITGGRDDCVEICFVSPI